MAIGKLTANVNGGLIGETIMHGGPNNEYEVLRFIAPVAGVYDVLASWRGPGDGGDTDLYLLLNSNSGSPLGFTNSTTTTGTIQVNSLLLSAGDTIDLSLGTLGSFLSDTTPVNLIITQNPVPEPSALGMLGIGIAGLLMLRQKCRRRV
jgi:hypothetical protein